MKRWFVLLSAALAFGLGSVAAEASDDALTALAREQVVPEGATAAEVLALCRAMVPADVVISGRVNRRSRHGRTIASYSYVLTRRAGETSLSLKDDKGEEVPTTGRGRIADTDVTWSDLTMDFLWWKDATFDGEAGASLSGIICTVLRVSDGTRTFRAWIDRRTGAMVQAAELRLVDGQLKTVREVFCTSLKKFGDRWAPKNIEVGPPGAKYRTKIIIDNVEEGKK